MYTSERRKKILDIFAGKSSLSYEEILDEMTRLEEDEIEILCDIDNLVFFRFLQHVGRSRSKLELRPVTEKQMRDDPQRVLLRLAEIEHEIPPWYRKLATLNVLHETQHIGSEEVLNSLKNTFPHVKWSPQVVEASLRILEAEGYVSKTGKERKKFNLSEKGKLIHTKSSIEKFFIFKRYKDEFTSEYRVVSILDIVRKHNETGISSGKIVSFLQQEYGIRCNKKRAIKNTLANMASAGMLRVSGRYKKRAGHVYHLGRTAEPLFGIKTASPPVTILKAPRIFLSYSSKDRVFVENIARKLSSDGFSVWYDDWEIHIGDSIVDKINKGISASDFLIIVLSKNSMNSRWVKKELNAATIKEVNSRGAYIIPVLLEECEIPSLLVDTKYADFSKNPEYAYTVPPQVQ